MNFFPNLGSLFINSRHSFLPQDDDTIVSFKSPPRTDIRCKQASAFSAINVHPIDQQVYRIRLVNSTDQREAANLLIKKRYSWRGYCIDAPLDNTPDRITLIAETREETVATVTLCLDGEIGLPADESFSDKLNGLRAQGRRLSEASKLAIDCNVPKQVFASLIHISYIFVHNIHGFTDWIIEVNPRHAGFYKKMLGFQELGEQRMCKKVNAPAVLLRLKMEDMGAQIKKFGGLLEEHGKERSFYPYFFPYRDEQGITERLKASRI